MKTKLISLLTMVFFSANAQNKQTTETEKWKKPHNTPFEDKQGIKPNYLTNENLVGEWHITFPNTLQKATVQFFENKNWKLIYSEPSYNYVVFENLEGETWILDPNKTIKLKYNNGSAFLEWQILSATENTMEVEETKHQKGAESIKTGKLILHKIIDKMALLQGTWVEAEYDFNSKKVIPPTMVKTGVRAETLAFEKSVTMTTAAGHGVNSIIYKGDYKIENDILTIEYLDFETEKGVLKEHNKFEVYKIIKLTNTELVLLQDDIDGVVPIKAYLKQK